MESAVGNAKLGAEIHIICEGGFVILHLSILNFETLILSHEKNNIKIKKIFVMNFMEKKVVKQHFENDNICRIIILKAPCRKTEITDK
ncbi:MAG: hypothetical protein JXK07_15410 [Spirochaetes bacterium]|nr:hypothetical protein [Spirochaetota bacterium]